MKRTRRRGAGLAFALLLPPGFAQSEWVTGLDRPTSMAFAPDGRLFVTEQGGALRVVKNGSLLASPVLTVPVHAHRERGLLGVELDPEFEANGRLYTYYTAAQPLTHNRLTRFVVVGDRVKSGSEKVLLELPGLDKEVHNGGGLHFGPDGKLYLSVGENARPDQAQSLDTFLGKLLRLDRDGGFPADNPFAAGTALTAPRRAIYASGLRNPFTFAFDPEDFRLFLNDVGKSKWEEINVGRAGANYGWPLTEGPTTDPKFDPPLVAYKHGRSDETGCAITGAVFYPAATGPAAFPAEYQGSYFFSDFCRGWLRRVPRGANAAEAFLVGGAPAIDLDVGPDGALYLLDYERGVVRRIAFTGSKKPQIHEPPRDVVAAAGEAATFSVVAGGPGPLAYQWRRDGAVLPGASVASLTLAPVQLGDDGAEFAVDVSNSFGTTRSAAATLRVIAGARPAIDIAAPAMGATYAASDEVRFAATAADAEDGTLPPSALRWRIDFHHDIHFHPFVAERAGPVDGTFEIPNTGETATDVWYRLVVQARDSSGLESVAFRDLLPRLTSFDVATEPPGLTVTVDGNPETAPVEVPSVVGMQRSLGVRTPQVRDGVLYDFAEWSDGGAAGHVVTAGEEPAVLVARFSPVTERGLAAEYFDRLGFAGPAVQVLEPRIDFDWGEGSPHATIQPDSWSARFSGFLLAATSGEHTLYLRSDEAARLYLDDELLIDHWSAHQTALRSAAATLEAGRPYSLRIEFFDAEGPASLRFLWRPPGAARRAVVPARALRPVPR